MKIIAENPAEERLLARIQSMSDEIAVQNNRATMMPIWTVVDATHRERDDYGAVAFLTGKAAEKHIVENSHHYDNPHTYVRSAHDNRELQDVIHFILLAGGQDIPENHYRSLR